MYYMFKIVKSGLKFLGTSKADEGKKNVIYINQDDLKKISKEVITNLSRLREVL